MQGFFELTGNAGASSDADGIGGGIGGGDPGVGSRSPTRAPPRRGQDPGPVGPPAAGLQMVEALATEWGRTPPPPANPATATPILYPAGRAR